MNKERRTFNNEARVAAMVASSNNVSRTKSMVNNQSVPKHFNSMTRSMSYMGRKRSWWFLPRDSDEHRTFSTSIIPNDRTKNSTIDSELDFIEFDGVYDDRYDNEQNLNSKYDTEEVSMKDIKMVDKYIPGPNGLIKIQVPKQEFQPRRSSTESNMFKVRGGNRSKRNSSFSSTTRNIVRNGAIKRTNSIKSRERNSKPRANPAGFYDFQPNKDIHITYEDGMDTIEKTVTTKPTKNHGFIETTTITCRNTQNSNQVKRSDTNTRKLDADIVMLRKNIEKTKMEERNLDGVVNNIRNAEIYLQKELNERKGTRTVYGTKNLNNSFKHRSLSSSLNRNLNTSPLVHSNEIIDLDQNAYDNNQEKAPESELLNSEEDNTSICSSLNKYGNISTIESVELEASMSATSQNILDGDQDTSNPDIQMLNRKLNAFIQKERNEDASEGDHDHLHRSLFLDIKHSSDFNSTSSINLNDSQISIIPSLDLGMKYDTDKFEKENIHPTVNKLSMAQHFRAATPKLVMHDDKYDEEAKIDLVHTLVNDNYNSGYRSSFDIPFSDISTFTMNVHNTTRHDSSMTTIDSLNKTDFVSQQLQKQYINQVTTSNKSLYVNENQVGRHSDVLENNSKSESSSIYSFHPGKNTSKQKIIKLNNLSDTIKNDVDNNFVNSERSLIISKTRGRRKKHRVTHSVDLDLRRTSDTIPILDDAIRSRSLTRISNIKTKTKNVSIKQNESLKNHSRNSSIGKSFKRFFGIHS